MGRKRKSRSSSPLVVAGGIAVGYAGLKALLGLKRGADEGFFQWTGPVTKVIDAAPTQVNLPIMYYRDDSFMAIFGADYEAVCALLPSPELYPVTLPGGRAMVAVMAFNYFETSIGPYGEVGIGLLCTYGQQGPPLLPLALEARHPGWGGLPIKDNRLLVTYSVRDGELIKTTVPTRAVYQLGLAPGSGTLELGDHPVADQLRGLDISTTAFVTKNFMSRSAILPAGESLGPVDRSPTWHPGTDQEYGRLTINYDEAGETIDLHAALRS